MLLDILSFFILLIPLVIIHEFGHFLAAKQVGITVLEFGIGFPPRMAKLFTRGDTDYTINWLPIGGFVRPYGEDFVRPKTEEEMESDLQEIEGKHIENPKSVFDAGPWQRIWFMVAGPVANFIAAVFIFVLVGLTGIPQTVADVSVVQMRPDSIDGLLPGDVITHVDGEVVEQISEYEDAVAGKDQFSLTVQRGEESLEVAVEADDFGGDGITEYALVSGISEGSPAEEAGLQLDDVIVAVDGQEIADRDMLIDYTKANEGVPVTFTIMRGTERLDYEIIPEEIDGVVRIGIGIWPAPLDEKTGAMLGNRNAETIARPADDFIGAVSYGVETFGRTMELMVTFPIDLIEGAIPLEQARPVSPVGISQIGGEVLRNSQDQGEIYPFLGLAAVISIALAVTNLLPIPGLDGGRILLVFVELLRGKPMEPEREGMVTMIGILFVLSLMVVVVIFDIVDPIDLSSF